MSDDLVAELREHPVTIAHAAADRITELEHAYDQCRSDLGYAVRRADEWEANEQEQAQRVAALEGAFAEFVMTHANCNVGARIGIHEADWIVDELAGREARRRRSEDPNA